MLGPIKSWLNDHGKEIDAFPIPPAQIAAVIQCVEEGKLSFSTASTKLLQLLLQNPQENPAVLAERNNLIQQSDSAELEPVINEVLEQLADKVVAYKKGKKGLLSLFVGEVMKRTKGKADPKKTNQMILEKLKQ